MEQSNNILNVQYNDILKVLSLKSEEGSMMTVHAEQAERLQCIMHFYISKEITCIQKSTS